LAFRHSPPPAATLTFIERYGDSTAGVLIVATGVMVAFLDW
jgi:hypothetical protein